jgi:peptide/nickel transport system substrate-binding protein
LSLVYGRLVRHKVGPDVQPGTFIVEPDLAERWEALDDTTYVFHLRQGVKWYNRPPPNGRELVAKDVKFTHDRFLTEKGNANRYILEPVDRIEVVDRYTVKFLLRLRQSCRRVVAGSVDARPAPGKDMGVEADGS